MSNDTRTGEVLDALREGLAQIRRERQRLDEKALEMEADIAALDRVNSRGLLNTKVFVNVRALQDLGQAALVSDSEATRVRALVKAEVSLSTTDFTSVEILDAIYQKNPDVVRKGDKDKSYHLRQFRRVMDELGCTEIRPANGTRPAVYRRPTPLMAELINLDAILNHQTSAS